MSSEEANKAERKKPKTQADIKNWLREQAAILNGKAKKKKTEGIDIDVLVINLGICYPWANPQVCFNLPLGFAIRLIKSARRN